MIAEWQSDKIMSDKKLQTLIPLAIHLHLLDVYRPDSGYKQLGVGEFVLAVVTSMVVTNNILKWINTVVAPPPK